MKATKFTLASVAFAAMLAAGVTTTSADVVLKAQNGEVASIPGGDSSSSTPEDSSNPDGSLSGGGKGPKEPETQVKTFFKDTEGKEIAPAQDGVQGTKEISGYVLVRTTVDEAGNVTHVYTGTTTVNFTAKFNDGRPDAHFSWTFPANTEVTYGRLFELAGLNPDDFDLGDYDWKGQTK